MRMMTAVFTSLVAAFLPIGYGTAADWSVNCYEGIDVGETKASALKSELYVMVDQTVDFDSDFQKHVNRKIQGFLKPGRRVVLLSFSAYAKGQYAEIEWRGRLHEDLSDDERYYIAQDTLARLDRCRQKKKARMPRALAMGLKEVFDGYSEELPRSEIANNMVRVGSQIIPRTRVTDDVHVLVVSDMMENSRTISFYRQGSLRQFDPQAALSTVKEAGLIGDFSEMKVSVVGAAYSLRQGYVSAEEMHALERFWNLYIDAGGGDLAGFGQPRLEGMIAR